MFRLFYISNVSPFFEQGMLQNLCEQSANRNREYGIGGALAFNGSNFGQVLEGDKDQVLDLYERITHDPRHIGAHVMIQREVKGRYYKDWGMQLIHGFDFSGLERAMQS